jgi:hypothetical protein
MNLSRPILPIFILSVSGSLHSHSQTPPAAPVVAPAAPKILLSPPADKVAWNIRYTYKKSREAVADEKKGDLASKALEPTDLARPEKIDYIIKAPVSSAITHYEGGPKEEAYYFGNFEFKKTLRQKAVLMSDLDSYPTVEQLFRKRFPGVHWVSPKHFVRVEVAHGEPCAYFKDVAAVRPKDTDKMDDLLDESKYGGREAWFSVATGLPVAFKTEDATGRYNFEAPPTTPVTIPPDVRESIARQAKYLAYLQQRAALTEPQAKKKP